jgi:hydrogenase maturation protein HypF
MVLESLVRRPRVAEGAWVVRDGVLDLTPLLERLLTATDATEGAELFHGSLVAALIDWALPELQMRGERRIALSGGCLMNDVLATGLVDGFAAAGIQALLPRQAPANDGGLALGQAWVAAQRV